MADTTGHPALLKRFYERKALETLEPMLRLAPLGVSKSIPKGEGKLIRWHRYDKVQPNLTPLTEKVTPAETAISTAEVEATIAQYGQHECVSDLLAFTAIDDQMVERSKRFGAAAADLIEQLHVAECDANGEKRYANDKTSATVTASDVLDFKNIIEMITIQEDAFVGEHESGKRVLVVGPASKFDLMADASAGGWSDINKYVEGAQGKILNGQFGEMYGARLVMSNRMTKVAPGAEGPGNDNVETLYYSYLIGSQAYGNVKLGGKDFQIITKPLGSSGTEDPLNQRASVGYKLMGYVVKFLGEDEPKRLIVNASASTFG